MVRLGFSPFFGFGFGFETRFHNVAHIFLQLVMSLPQTPESWNYKRSSPRSLLPEYPHWWPYRCLLFLLFAFVMLGIESQPFPFFFNQWPTLDSVACVCVSVRSHPLTQWPPGGWQSRASFTKARLLSLPPKSLFWMVHWHCKCSICLSVLDHACHVSIRRLRSENNEFKTRLGSIVRPFPTNKQKQTTLQQANVLQGKTILHYSIPKPAAFLYWLFVCMHVKDFCIFVT